MNPIPLVSESASSSNYLSLRRLSVWFAEPMVKMRVMAVLVEKCKVLRLSICTHSTVIRLFNEFMMNLLRCVCSPLFEMVRRWVFEREREDTFGEFFVDFLISSTQGCFVSPSLAQRILRTGKSSNFLRVCFDDHGWADAASEAAEASGATTRRGGLGYGETDALEHLVSEAAKRQRLGCIVTGK
uniref:Gamma-tubulin complex component 3 n=1 Tax=Noccaea caerulescens TaxID=107243 RepID=A0A1J3HHD2_NOCCA